MLRTLAVVDRRVVSVPTPPVVLAAGVAKDILPDTRSINSAITDTAATAAQDEYAYIELFNAGAGNVYIGYGVDADNVLNFSAYLVAGSMLEVPTRERISGYSPTGATVAISIFKRITANTNYT